MIVSPVLDFGWNRPNHPPLPAYFISTLLVFPSELARLGWLSHKLNADKYAGGIMNYSLFLGGSKSERDADEVTGKFGNRLNCTKSALVRYCRCFFVQSLPTSPENPILFRRFSDVECFPGLPVGLRCSNCGWSETGNHILKVGNCIFADVWTQRTKYLFSNNEWIPVVEK